MLSAGKALLLLFTPLDMSVLYHALNWLNGAPAANCFPSALLSRWYNLVQSFSATALGSANICSGACNTNVVDCAGVIAVEPDVHSVTLPGSGQPFSLRPGMANGRAPAPKKSALAKTVSQAALLFNCIVSGCKHTAR